MRPGNARARHAGWAALVASLLPATAVAQATPSPADHRIDAKPHPAGRQDDVVVTARRGDAKISPESELSEAEIARYGADTIAQLLAAIGPLIDGSGAAPVVLVNGKRIGTASGITGFPPEALSRLAILPPDAAARYGYPSGQRVVNLVLKPKFASWDGSASTTLATAGGRDSEAVSATRVVIEGATYWNAQLQLSRDSMLLKNARPLANGAGPIDLAAQVRGIDGGDALLPASRSLALNLGVTRPVGAFSAALNLSLVTNRDVQYLGYPGATPMLSADEAPLASRQQATTLGLSATLTGAVAGWNANLIADYTRSASNSSFDRSLGTSAMTTLANPDAPQPRTLAVETDTTRSQTNALSLKLALDRQLATLPAGPLTVNVTSGVSRMTIANHSMPQATDSGLQRTEFDWQASFSLPLTQRAQGAGALLGELSANLVTGLSAITGSSIQRQAGASANWSPAPAVQLFASYDIADVAPDIAQLSSPRTETVVRLYDPIRQEVAEPIWITGGNPALRRGKRTNLSLKGLWRPFGDRLLTINLGYQRRVATGGVAGFPQLTPAVEQALADRIVRDATGRLIAVDARPIAIDRDTSAQLTTGFSLLLLPPASAGPGERAGRWQVSLVVNHSWSLDSLLVLPGLPALDRLGRDGGQPRHRLSWQIVGGRPGIGVTLNGQWQSAAEARNIATAGGETGYLYHAATQIDLGLFVEPGKMFAPGDGKSWLANSRISLDIRNLFNGYQHITLPDGRIPAGFDRYLLNPLGRTVQFALRKRF